jgi:hypothetical protein
MTQSISLADYVLLGQRLYLLRTPSKAHVSLIQSERDAFLQSLETCGLTHTRRAAEALNQSELMHDNATGFLTGGAAAEIAAFMAVIRATLDSEIATMQASAIHTDAVSNRLRTLSLKLNDTQQHLISEMIACLESGAFRSAVVMGWNFAYDFMRQWVFDHHLQNFNRFLIGHFVDRNGNSLYEPIINYEDFYSGRPGEWTVIDTWHLAGTIDGKTRDHLRQCLRKRNDYAHPSFKQPSVHQANAYIEDLIDTISADPFK